MQLNFLLFIYFLLIDICCCRQFNHFCSHAFDLCKLNYLFLHNHGMFNTITAGFDAHTYILTLDTQQNVCLMSIRSWKLLSSFYLVSCNSYSLFFLSDLSSEGLNSQQNKIPFFLLLIEFGLRWIYSIIIKDFLLSLRIRNLINDYSGGTERFFWIIRMINRSSC